jgi:drug/metabolite transporter (DMT)-like permease
MAWLTLGETFTWLKILGAAITMAGVAWAQFGGGKPPSKEAGQPDCGVAVSRSSASFSATQAAA